MLSKTNILELLYNKWAVRSALGFSILLSLLIVVTLYQGVTFLFSTKPVVKPQSVLVKAQPLPKMSSWHLFGVYEPKKLNLKDLPNSTLNLQLSGVFMATPEKESQAVILVPGGDEKVYNVGDTVPGGAKLYRILADSIIIQRNAHLEKLALPKNSIKFAPAPKGLDLRSTNKNNE